MLDFHTQVRRNRNRWRRRRWADKQLRAQDKAAIAFVRNKISLPIENHEAFGTVMISLYLASEENNLIADEIQNPMEFGNMEVAPVVMASVSLLPAHCGMQTLRPRYLHITPSLVIEIMKTHADAGLEV